MQILAAAHEGTLAAAMAALDAGELIVVPGDLRYHLAADALDDAAVGRLFEAVHRGADRPLAIMLGGYEDLHHVAYGTSEARALADTCWPGPTALRLRARPWIPDALTAGAQEVDVLVPAQPFTRDLAKHFGPLAIVPDQEPLGGILRVDAGALPGGEAKVIRPSEPART